MHNHLDTGIQDKELYALLAQHRISFHLTFHPPITTMEEGKLVSKGLPGIVCKNLFLKSNLNQYAIYSGPSHVKVDLTEIAHSFQLNKMSLAGKDEVISVLKTSLGCVTPFAVLNDGKKNNPSS